MQDLVLIVYLEELDDTFQLYTEFELVLVKSYIKNEKTPSKEIKILFYPTQEFIADKSSDEVKSRFEAG